jgi:hypothetical protein
MMRRRAIVGTAATVSMVSSARRNRAERKAIEQQTEGNEQAMQDMSASAPQSDMAAQLQELQGLLTSGVITQAEFDAKKKQILGI